MTKAQRAALILIFSAGAGKTRWLMRVRPGWFGAPDGDVALVTDVVALSLIRRGLATRAHDGKRLTLSDKGRWYARDLLRVETNRVLASWMAQLVLFPRGGTLLPAPAPTSRPATGRDVTL